MKKAILFIVVVVLSSCAIQKQSNYRPSPIGDVRHRTNEKQRAWVSIHLITLIVVGWVYHACNESSN